MLLVSSVRKSCSDLVAMSIVYAIVLLGATIIRMMVLIWVVMKGYEVTIEFLQRAKHVFRWICLIEFCIMLFLTIGLTFALSYVNKKLDCESLHEVVNKLIFLV